MHTNSWHSEHSGVISVIHYCMDKYLIMHFTTTASNIGPGMFAAIDLLQDLITIDEQWCSTSC